MVKRAPPPPSEDDTNYFAVFNPYPSQPYLTKEETQSFARWLACIVGEENLIAFSYKTKSSRIVMVETRKDSVDLRRLLGEHRWSEVIRDPSDNDKHEVSRIYQCKMSSSWDIDKSRWMRVYVEDAWFRRWSPENDSNIVYPYPLSHFCQPPSENTVTDASLCLKLPDSVFRPTTARSALHPILAPVPRAAAPALAPPREGSSSEDHLFPPGLSLPGQVLCPAVPTSPHFVPAFHGSDHPKIDGVQVVVSSPSPSTGSDASSPSTSLWADYGTEEARAAPTECSAHGTVCNSGICKICAQRAREERLAERERERVQDRDAWRQAKGRRQRGSGQQQGGGGASERGGSPDLGARPARLSADALAHTGSGKRSERGSAPAMPAHLRRGAGASSYAASSATAVSSRAALSRTSTSSPSTDAGDEDEDDTQSVISSSPSEAPSVTSSVAPSTMGAWQKPMPSFLRRGAGPAAAPAAPSESTARSSATKKPVFLTSVAPSARDAVASGPPVSAPPKNAWAARKQWAVPNSSSAGPSIQSTGGSRNPGTTRPKGSSGLPPPARMRPSSVIDDSASESMGSPPSCVYAPRVRVDWADSLSDSDLDPEPF